MKTLSFVRFTREDYPLYVKWSNHEKIHPWLGDPTEEWLDYVLTAEDTFIWMIYEGDKPIANLQIDQLEDDSTQAQITIMISPQHHRQGYGRQILSDILKHPQLAHVRRFYAFIKPSNSASVGLFTKMGYTPVSLQPSETGYIEYEWMRL